MMHNQGVYMQQQGQQGGGPPMMIQQQRSPQQQSQAHNSYMIPQQQQQASAQQGSHQPPQFIPPYQTMPQHVPANQLTQIPGMLFHQDTPFLMCIPMIFNARECTWACQNGVIVPPNTATTISGFHVIHQQPLQQQHQQMQNGYGAQISQQQQQQQHAPSAGTSGFGDTGNAATRASPNHPPPSNVPSAGMAGGGVIYGYPQQSLSHYPVMTQAAPGQFYGPPPPHGFHPSQQIQMNPQSVVYGQQTGHLVGSQTAGPMQADAGSPHGILVDGQNTAASSHSLDQGKTGLTNGSPSQSSEAQSRSSSYSSNLDVEQAVGHDGHPSDSATPQDETTFSRSTTPSPETVGDLITITENNHPNVRGDTDEISASSKADVPRSVSSIGLKETEPLDKPDAIRSGNVTGNTNLLNGQTETSKERTHRSSPGPQPRKGTSGATSAASGNRSSGQSPSIAQAAVSPVNVVDKPSLPADDDAESHNRSPRGSTSGNAAPSPVPAQPIKSWAALVGQSGPKGTTSPAVNKPAGRPPVTPHSETMREKPAQVEPPMPSARSGYSKEEYGRHSGQSSSGQQRVYEFPKLKDEEADAYPDELQVYIRDIPVTVTSDVISNAMRRYGELVDVRLRYHHGNRNLRFCFVLFTKREPADLLLEKGTVMISGINLMVQNKKKKGPNYNSR